MQVYGLTSCDMTRKALADLRRAGHAPAFRDVRDEPLDAETRRAILDALGPLAINRASTTWRELPEAERDRDPMELLALYPTVMKRPVIRQGESWFAGWKPDVQAALL